MQQKDILTVKEAAKYMDVSDDLIYRAIKDGRLPAARVGTRAYRIRRVDLDQLFRTKSEEEKRDASSR